MQQVVRGVPYHLMECPQIVDIWQSWLIIIISIPDISCVHNHAKKIASTTGKNRDASWTNIHYHDYYFMIPTHKNLSLDESMKYIYKWLSRFSFGSD